MTMSPTVGTTVPVTLLYGGANALLVTLLGVYVSLLRMKFRKYVSTELPRELVRPVRAHGNAAEWVPLGIVLLALLELGGADPVALHVLGGSLLLARIIHASGILGRSRVTVAGATLNYLVLVAMSGWALWLHFAH